MLRSSLFFLLFLPAFASGQNFETLFPGSSGTALLDSLVAHYKPATVLNYAQARDTLYAKVLAVDDDSLRCIYSGYTLYLDPTQDPTQYIYLNGSSLGMNTEHAYPQSKGAADGNGHSDMHHLFPARIPVNEARGDYPFAEIPDAQTEKWFYNTIVQSTIPTQHIDWYAESKTGAFEPREASKGDLARAVFYFYTMYKAAADAADPNYFELQRPTLCQWNELDPADSAELIKTWRIAPYQENKPNPFILDCTLAYRSYCPQTLPGCSLGTTGPAGGPQIGAVLSPNPFTGNGWVTLSLPFNGNVEITAFNLLGKQLGVWTLQNAPEGQVKIPLDWQVNDSGAGMLRIRLVAGASALQQTIPVLWVR